MRVVSPAPATTVNENSAIYYSGQSWNALPRIVAYMSEDFTGDPAKWWVRDFQERFPSKPLGTRPVVNCGNGRPPAEGRPAGHGAVALLTRTRRIDARRERNRGAACTRSLTA